MRYSSKVDRKRFKRRIVVYNSGRFRSSGWMFKEYRRTRRKWSIIAKSKGYEMEIYEDESYSVFYYEEYVK